MSDPFETNKYDTLKIKIECTNAWKSAFLMALEALLVGWGWRIIENSPNNMFAILVRKNK